MRGMMYTTVVNANTPCIDYGVFLHRIRCPRCRGEGHRFSMARFSFFLAIGLACLALSVYGFSEMFNELRSLKHQLSYWEQKCAIVQLGPGFLAIWYAVTGGRRVQCNVCLGEGRVTTLPARD